MDTALLGLGIGGGIIVYVYVALCLMFIAQKTDTPYPWLAWIPIANVFLMAMIAKKPWLWALIMVIAYGIEAGTLNGPIAWLGWIFEIVGLVFTILIWIAIFQALSQARMVGHLDVYPDSELCYDRRDSVF